MPVKGAVEAVSWNGSSCPGPGGGQSEIFYNWKIVFKMRNVLWGVAGVILLPLAGLLWFACSCSQVASLQLEHDY